MYVFFFLNNADITPKYGTHWINFLVLNVYGYANNLSKPSHECVVHYTGPHAMSPSLLQHPLHHCSAGRHLKKIQVMGQYHNTTSYADSVMVIVCNHLRYLLRFKASNWQTSILSQLTIAVCLPKEQMATAQNHAALKPPHKMVRY